MRVPVRVRVRGCRCACFRVRVFGCVFSCARACVANLQHHNHKNIKNKLIIYTVRFRHRCRYYSYGVVMLALVVLPNAFDAAMWHFEKADFEALGFGLALWPLAAFLLTYANNNASPVTVMAFAPLQIVATMALEYVSTSNKTDVTPTLQEGLGAGTVILGLAFFISGYALKEQRKKRKINSNTDHGSARAGWGRAGLVASNAEGTPLVVPDKDPLLAINT